MVRNHRSTIFGAFSTSITKKHKNDTWDNITKKAIAMGLVSADRDAKYVREVYWQNLRKRTMNKLDSSRSTGSGGGKSVILDDIDNMIIDIIGMLLLLYESVCVKMNILI